MPASNGGDDFVWACGPCEGSRVKIVLIHEAVDGGLQVGDRSEDAAFQSSFDELGEEAFVFAWGPGYSSLLALSLSAGIDGSAEACNLPSNWWRGRYPQGFLPVLRFASQIRGRSTRQRKLA
jgi:hypothetical protein